MRPRYVNHFCLLILGCLHILTAADNRKAGFTAVVEEKCRKKEGDQSKRRLTYDAWWINTKIFL